MVYVDNYRAPFRGMRMSHLAADSVEELDEFAGRLGLSRDWRQDGSFVHYDVSEGKRQQAIKMGAKSVRPTELIEILVDRLEAERGED